MHSEVKCDYGPGLQRIRASSDPGGGFTYDASFAVELSVAEQSSSRVMEDVEELCLPVRMVASDKSRHTEGLLLENKEECVEEFQVLEIIINNIIELHFL